MTAPERPTGSVPPSKNEHTNADDARPRGILIPLESRAAQLCVLVLLIAGALWLARALVSPAVADYLAAGATSPAALESALTWAPDNPDLHLRLARVYGTALEGANVQRAAEHVMTALRQRPTFAPAWLQLSLVAERQGDTGRARQALDVMQRMDRHHVGLRWEAAALLLRWGERDAALEHLRYVLAVDPSQCDAAFQLASAVLGPAVSAASLLPAEPQPLTAILQLAIRNGELDLARAAWERRVSLPPEVPPPLQRAYVELLIAEGDARGARQLWPYLVPSAGPAAPDNLLWNGGFEADRLQGWGFDWQVRRMWGVEVSLDRFEAAGGRQSLRLTFNSFPMLDFAGVSQQVAVEPGRAYHLRAMAKAFDFTTQSGLKLQLVTPDGEEVLAETPTIAGTTTDWVALETYVQVPVDTPFVKVRLRREKAPSPEGNLGGKVWLDEVTLTPMAGGA